jgi:hypothetical protein
VHERQHGRTEAAVIVKDKPRRAAGPRRAAKPGGSPFTRTAEHRPAIHKRNYRHDGYTALDMFSGFGGLTLGIKIAGFTMIMAANHNRYKVEVHEANHPEVEHWIADLVDPDAAD